MISIYVQCTRQFKPGTDQIKNINHKQLTGYAAIHYSNQAQGPRSKVKSGRADN